MARDTSLTGNERILGDDDLIVTKTDTKGHITYGNRVFERISGYAHDEFMGKPHNIVRHPDMPRCVFKLLWDTIAAGNEIFAYVLNRSKNGDHYWVLAHVTPSYSASGQLIGYHSNRRAPTRWAIDQITPVYQTLLTVEKQFENPKQQMAASLPAVVNFLKTKNMSYDEFLFSLAREPQPAHASAGAAA
jgi:PAS domain S-box-containing protein